MLNYAGGLSILESYNLPIKIRNWWARRLEKQLQKEQEEVEAAKKSKTLPRK